VIRRCSSLPEGTEYGIKDMEIDLRNGVGH
jgi:hypothetical protein